MNKELSKDSLKDILKKIDEAYDLIDGGLNRSTWDELEDEVSQGLEVLLQIERKYKKELD